MTQIGTRIAELRRSREPKLTQEGLADLAGCHTNTIQAIEATGRAQVSTIQQIASALGVSAAELLGAE